MIRPAPASPEVDVFLTGFHVYAECPVSFVSLNVITVIVFHNAYATNCDVTYRALLGYDCDQLVLTYTYTYVLNRSVDTEKP